MQWRLPAQNENGNPGARMEEGGRANLRSSHEFAPFRVTRGRESQWHEAAAALVVWMNAQIGVE